MDTDSPKVSLLMERGDVSTTASETEVGPLSGTVNTYTAPQVLPQRESGAPTTTVVPLTETDIPNFSRRSSAVPAGEVFSMNGSMVIGESYR